MRLPSRSRPGYIFLMSVLFTGIIGLAAVLSMLLLSWASEQSGITFTQSTQALSMATNCTEFALQSLRKNPHYAGNDTLIFAERGSCRILPIQRAGDRRILCLEGASGQTTRRLKVIISRLFPAPYIESYQEVRDSSACL